MTGLNSQEQPARRRKRRKVRKPRPQEDLRTETVGVRISPAELAKLAAQAKTQHATKAAILRAAWLGQALATPLPEVLGPAARPARVLSPTELVAYRQLVGAAARLNQLGAVPEAEAKFQAQARELFVELRHLLAELVPPRVEKK